MSGQTHTETRNDAAILGEQFRKATEVTAEQTRQTMRETRDQLQENLNRAQQAQNDWARMMLRVGEQNGQLATATISSLWDVSLSMLKLANWGEEQAEHTMLRLIEQSRAARDEGTAILNQASDQIRHDQAEIFRLAQEGVRVGVFYAGKTGRREAEPVK